MEHLNRALEIQPQSVVCRFHKARILFDTRKYAEAERELNDLRSLSPDEAHVFYLLGRVHRKLDNAHLAMLNFSWATEIDPRGEQNNASVVSEGTYDGDAADLTDISRRGAVAAAAAAAAVAHTPADINTTNALASAASAGRASIGPF